MTYDPFDPVFGNGENLGELFGDHDSPLERWVIPRAIVYDELKAIT